MLLDLMALRQMDDVLSAYPLAAINVTSVAVVVQ